MTLLTPPGLFLQQIEEYYDIKVIFLYPDQQGLFARIPISFVFKVINV